MVICQYFLKGACKFGDRCFNEHRRPESRGSYSQGAKQRNYHQESRDFSSHGRHGNNNGSYDRNSGGGRYSKNTGYYNSNYDDYGHDYRNQKNWGGRRDGYGNHHDGHGSGRDVGYSGHRDDSRDGYSRYQGGKKYSRDKYHYDARDKNRFSALSHQPDPELPSFHEHRSQQTRGRTYSTASQQSVTMDQKVERVRKDIREWHESGQWPLSCYAPLGNEPCLDGLLDISVEEMRSEAYKANTDGNAASYAQSLQQTMEKYRHKKQELAAMSSSALQEEISRSSQPSSAIPGGLFGDLGSSTQSPGETSFSESMSTSSTGLFGPSPQSKSTLGPFMSTSVSRNPSTNPSTVFGASSSPFGSTQVNNASSSTTLFGKSQEIPTKEDDSSSAQMATDNARSATVTSLRCSEEDLKAYRADRFVMGAIPECPPPLELC